MYLNPWVRRRIFSKTLGLIRSSTSIIHFLVQYGEGLALG